MDITIVSTKIEHSLNPTRMFGILLSKCLTSIHMIHWYTTNFNRHEILGDLYEDLDSLFDKLQEEIIGTSKIQKIPFPSFSVESYNIDDIEQFVGDETVLMDLYLKCTTLLIAMLTSREFDNYVESVKSGLNNTREDIISRINKSNYLLEMIND